MADKRQKQRQSESKESRVLAEHAFELARALGIGTLLVQADGLRDVRIIERARS